MATIPQRDGRRRPARAATVRGPAGLGPARRGSAGEAGGARRGVICS